MVKPIEKRFYLTIVTKGDTPHHKTFWFGRADMGDNLRPIKIEAPNGKTAWERLEEWDKEKSKCST